MDKKEVYMVQGTHYKEMALQILKAAGIAGCIGDRHKRVGIKPNLVVAKHASDGATTHPELVDAVITYLTEEGVDNLCVLEGSWVGDLTSQAVRVSGIYDVCRKYQVPFIDLQQDDMVTCNAAGMELKICKEASRIDYLINLPVLKGHCQTLITCALKNAKGLIPNLEKRRFHTLGLHGPIAHLNTVIHQDFILVDNICGDLDFEEGGNPVYMNRVLGFFDPVLCDSFAAECMGYKPHDVAYIKIAEELGVGSSDTKAAVMKMQNQGVLDIKPVPKSKKVERLSSYAAAQDACSACYGSLIYALDRLKEEGCLKKDKIGTIAIGQGYQGKCGELGIGQCTSCFKRYLKGCPPKAVDIVEFLREEWK